VSGAAGLDELRAGTFHCVLLNFDLPDMTGFEFLIAAEVDGRAPCGIVLVTDAEEEAVVAEATKRGVHGYLAKDRVNTTDLWNVITQAVVKAETEQRLAGSLRDSAAKAALEQQILKRKVDAAPSPVGHTDQIVQRKSGSGFWFEVPADTPASPPQPELTYASSTPGYRVLLVDDLEMNRSVIGTVLGKAGHAVTEAGGGDEAVWLACQYPFDMILMDVRMPEVDGLEATRRIRALAGPCREIPILALTAHSSPDQKEKCRDAGMDGHLAKPLDYGTLICAVDSVMAASASAMRGG
jgi:CheY-like chemotaxis protein